MIGRSTYVAARFPSEPLLDNALLLGMPDDRVKVEPRYAAARSFAVWTWEERDDLADTLEAAGHRRSEIKGSEPPLRRNLAKSAQPR